MVSGENPERGLVEIVALRNTQLNYSQTGLT